MIIDDEQMNMYNPYIGKSCSNMSINWSSVLSCWMGRVVEPMNDKANVPWIVFPSTKVSVVTVAPDPVK